MNLYKEMSAPVNRICQRRPPIDPAWIVFVAGKNSARVPFADRQDALDSGWQYILDITSIGFRADRVGDAIVITGGPSDHVGGLA
jgi:hypothetical protein